MNDGKSIGKKVDEVVEKVKEKAAEVKGKVKEAKEKIAGAKGDASTMARDISKGVKRAVEDTGDAITDLLNKKR